MNDYYSRNKSFRKQTEFYDYFMFLIKAIIVVSAVKYWRSQAIFSQVDGSVSTGNWSAAPSNFIEYEANVSAYCPCEKCCEKWAKVLPRVTASGYIIKPGDKFVAAPKNIPFGTMIDIPGYGKVPVLDRGGAIKDNKLDVYFDTHEQALKWGRKHIKVRMYIKDEG